MHNLFIYSICIFNQCLEGLDHLQKENIRHEITRDKQAPSCTCTQGTSKNWLT
jgi:hypothetical protein